MPRAGDLLNDRQLAILQRLEDGDRIHVDDTHGFGTKICLARTGERVAFADVSKLLQARALFQRKSGCRFDFSLRRHGREILLGSRVRHE